MCRPAATSVYFTGDAVCRSYTTPLLCDVDGDGQLEVLLGSNNGHLYALDGKTGQERWKVQTGGMIRGSPVMLDVDGDGADELFVPSGARLLAFETHSRGVCWPMYKGEPQHLGWQSPQADLGLVPSLPRQGWPEFRLFWQAWVMDTLWYVLYHLQRRVLSPLGIELIDYVY
jgi:hypothetical protein